MEEFSSDACESLDMRAARPIRGSHDPGTFWYYNNWDFNVLGTIFRQETGADIFEDFKKQFAVPLQMEDFRVTLGGLGLVDTGMSGSPAEHRDFVCSAQS